MNDTYNTTSSARYRIPAPRDRYILRASLQRRLTGISGHRLTIIKAGAGSGKTTLLSVYIRQQRPQHLYWLTLDECLNQVFVFWQYLFGALRAELPKGDDSLAICFSDNIQKEVLERLLPVFSERLATGHEIYLILDDFQHISDPYLLRTLRLFLGNLRKNIHLVILSRTMPALDIGRLYMQDSLLLIGEEDMRLTANECREFLTRTLLLPDDTRKAVHLDDIISKANGWIGGAQLLALAESGNNPHMERFSAFDKRLIFDYMEKEIFLPLGDEEQLFLTKTAVFTTFDEGLCARYLPEYNFEHMIGGILEKNLFVIVMDSETKAFRYHDMLREFLLFRLSKTPDKRRTLYLGAAAALFEQERYDECAALLLQGREYGALMERLLQMPQTAVTFGFIMQVPLEAIGANPNFAYQYFFCYYAALEPEKCRQIYDYIIRHLSTDVTFKAFQNADLFFDVDRIFDTNRTGGSLNTLSAAQIQTLPLNRISRAYLLNKEAYFLLLQGDREGAMQYLDRAEAIYRETGNIYIEDFVLSVRTQVLETYGELGAALLYYRQMYALLESTPTLRISYYIGIAGIHIRRMQLTKAEEELEEARKLGAADVDTLQRAYLDTLAEWQYLTGRQEQAVESLLSLGEDTLYQNLFFAARLLRYPLYRRNNRQLAASFLESYEQADNDRKSTDIVRKSTDIDLLACRIAYELGDKDSAIRTLSRLLAGARKCGNKLKITEAALLLARFLYFEANESAASQDAASRNTASHDAEPQTAKEKDSLWMDERSARRDTGSLRENGLSLHMVNLVSEAVSYALPEQLRAPFFFEADFLSLLLDRESRELQAQLSETQLLFVTDILDNRTDAKTPAPLLLTARELEVLKCISAGRTNKEVAERLCISMATVKTHLINIYGKLGVSNRLQAVNKAKSLRIF